MPWKIFYRPVIVDVFPFLLKFTCVFAVPYTCAHLHAPVPLLLAYSCGRESGFRRSRPLHSGLLNKGKSLNLIYSLSHASERSIPFRRLTQSLSFLPLSCVQCDRRPVPGQPCPVNPTPPRLGTYDDVTFEENSLEAQSNPQQMQCHTPAIKSMDLCGILMACPVGSYITDTYPLTFLAPHQWCLHPEFSFQDG